MCVPVKPSFKRKWQLPALPTPTFKATLWCFPLGPSDPFSFFTPPISLGIKSSSVLALSVTLRCLISECVSTCLHNYVTHMSLKAGAGSLFCPIWDFSLTSCMVQNFHLSILIHHSYFTLNTIQFFQRNTS